MNRISALAYRTRYRIANRWWDLLAALHGYCNDCPVKTGTPDETGGYSHWRCTLRRWHGGDHRYRNYVWNADGSSDYAPVDHCPSQPWDRHSVPTMRQARERRRSDADYAAKQRAICRSRDEQS